MSPEVVGKSKKSIKSNIPVPFLRAKPKKVVLSNLSHKDSNSAIHTKQTIFNIYLTKTPQDSFGLRDVKGLTMTLLISLESVIKLF